MEENTYRTQKKGGLFAFLERTLGLNSLFFDGLPTHYITPVIYLFCLGMLYVGNTHYHESLVRKIRHLESVTAELKVEFTTLKANYMLYSNQSEVAKSVAHLGIVESKHPPFKIKANDKASLNDPPV